MNLYIASCVEDGGIYHYNKEADGTFTLVEKTELDRPMYMIIENRKMYVVLMAPFPEEESGVVVFDLLDDGRLGKRSAIMGTKGVEACHIAVWKEQIYCANYTSGSVILLPDKLVQHSGCGPNPDRQEGPHTHFVGMTPDEKFLCVTDLGLDRIYLYHPDLTPYQSFEVPKGQGVRHLAFSEDGQFLFAANELGSTVTAFAYKAGQLTALDHCSSLPEGCSEANTIAAIRIREGRIYVSNRGHDSVAELEWKDGKLRFLHCYPCGGASPRDMIFAEGDLICTNQLGNLVTVLDTAAGYSIRTSWPLRAPLCVCVEGEQ